APPPAHAAGWVVLSRHPPPRPLPPLRCLPVGFRGCAGPRAVAATPPLPGPSRRPSRGPAKTDRTRPVISRKAGSVSFGGDPPRPFEFASALEAALAGPREPASRDALVPQNGSRSARSRRRRGSDGEWRPRAPGAIQPNRRCVGASNQCDQETGRVGWGDLVRAQ